LCGLLVSCDRQPDVTTSSQSSKQTDIVWVQIRGAEIAVPNKGSEEWAIRLATVMFQTSRLGSRPCFLEVIAVHQDPPKYSGRSKIPDPPSPPTVTQIHIPDTMLEALRRSGRHIKRTTESQIINGSIVDAESGESGLTIFSVGNILWTSPTEAEVSGGIWSGPEAISGHTYYLRKLDGVWKVVESTMDYIS
ncbi:MAG: hypothetical protein KGR69_04805, partial [Verrucomicrobia bacterium]|nr:hypothetical protein [Verrucomicrobiota bacterium]